jgi:hypothetical protein
MFAYKVRCAIAPDGDHKSYDYVFAPADLYIMHRSAHTSGVIFTVAPATHLLQMRLARRVVWQQRANLRYNTLELLIKILPLRLYL